MWARLRSVWSAAASETGVVDFGNDPVVQRGRLGPGDRLVVRFASQQFVTPEQFRDERRRSADFRPVVKSWVFPLPEPAATGTAGDPAVDRDLVRFGYTKDELKDVVSVIASGAGEPVSSMGDDAAQPFLERRMPVAAYLRQKFAQVTNPPIDSVREGFVFDMRAWVGSGDLSVGHAKVLLGLERAEEQLLAAERIRKENLTVRATERLVESMRAGSKPATKRRAAAATSEAIFADLEKRLQQHVGTRVRIVGKANAGKIEIQYFSPEDLDRILQLLRLPSG